MRAGKLDRAITIERMATTIADHGGVTHGWTVVLTTRAQIVKSNTEEFIRAYGADEETVTVFRTRWLANVKLSDRIISGGSIFDIKDLKEIGRRRGTEIRCVARPAQ